MANTWAKQAAGLCVLGIVLFILGQALPYWVSGPDRNFYSGLWEKYVADWVNAVRALEVIADILAIITVALLIVYIRKLSGLTSLRLIQAAFLLAILTAVCSLVGIAVFGGKYGHGFGSVHLDISFYLTMAGGIVYAVVAVFVQLERRATGAAGSYISI